MAMTHSIENLPPNSEYNCLNALVLSLFFKLVPIASSLPIKA